MKSYVKFQVKLQGKTDPKFPAQVALWQ